VGETLSAVCAVVRVPLPPQECPRDTLVKWQQAIYTEGVINGALLALHTVAEAARNSAADLHVGRPSPPHVPIDLLSRLVLLSSNFLNQFMELGGLAILRRSQALSPESPVKVIVNALLLVCQAARSSEAFYVSIHGENLYVVLWRLLCHVDGSVRAKACNLIGNLCRHSAFFYKCLVTPLSELPPSEDEPQASPTPPLHTTVTLLARLVECCGDGDASTRKFACFAVGNAAFHGPLLYPHLKGSIPHLVHALRDGDEKCRANAAGALGNLVRNSSELCEDLNAAHVARHLLAVAASGTAAAAAPSSRRDPHADHGAAALALAPATGGGAANNNNGNELVGPRRIALFSLGTLAVYAKCRGALERLDGPSLEHGLAAIERDTRSRAAPDKQVLEHLVRIRKKLTQPGAP